MKRYKCTVCGYIYDPVEGDPSAGIEPGTPFSDLPADYVCPICGAGKDEFIAKTERGKVNLFSGKTSYSFKGILAITSRSRSQNIWAVLISIFLLRCMGPLYCWSDRDHVNPFYFLINQAAFQSGMN